LYSLLELEAWKGTEGISGTKALDKLGVLTTKTVRVFDTEGRRSSSRAW
jgi:hypothetical protein